MFNNLIAATVLGVCLVIGLLSYPILGAPIIIALMYYHFKG